MSLEQTRERLIGRWISFANEVRPSANKNPDGTLRPLFMTRDFSYAQPDAFKLLITTSADPSGRVPLATIEIHGHMQWRGEHPIAEDAQKVDFIADEKYQVTPRLQAFADFLNNAASESYAVWKVDETQSILGKNFAPFGLIEGRHFKECDLVYLKGDLLFWGARHIDGRAFDTEENRPTHLQIPLMRK